MAGPRRVPIGGGREMLDSMRNNELKAFLNRADALQFQVAAVVTVIDPETGDELETHLRAFNPYSFLIDAENIEGGDIRELIADTLADAHSYLPDGFGVVGIQLFSGDTAELHGYSGARA